MKAIAYEKYGSPEVLQLKDLARPRVEPHQVLIRVQAAGVNPIDWRIRSGSLKYLLPIRFPVVPGFDISGTIEEVGSEVKQFQPGEEVYCFADQMTGGGYAEFASVWASVVASKPKNLSFPQAAAVPLAAITALQGLRDHGQLSAGQQVLITGASGGVGSFAVQIAKIFGAVVTGVCSTNNVEVVQSLGVDEVIDYTQTDYTKQSNRYDVVYDCASKSSYGKSKRVLTKTGRYITLVPNPILYLRRWWTRYFSSRRCLTFLALPNAKDLLWLKEQLEAEQIHVLIDRVIPLEQAAEAHRISESGHPQGKIVLQIGS